MTAVSLPGRGRCAFPAALRVAPPWPAAASPVRAETSSKSLLADDMGLTANSGSTARHHTATPQSTRLPEARGITSFYSPSRCCTAISGRPDDQAVNPEPGVAVRGRSTTKHRRHLAPARRSSRVPQGPRLRPLPLTAGGTSATAAVSCRPAAGFDHWVWAAVPRTTTARSTRW